MGMSGAPYNPNLDEQANAVSVPELLLCDIASDGTTGAKKLVLSSTIREKWQDDPIRKAAWVAEIAKFDARCLTYTALVMQRATSIIQFPNPPQTNMH